MVLPPLNVVYIITISRQKRVTPVDPYRMIVEKKIRLELSDSSKLLRVSPLEVSAIIMCYGCHDILMVSYFVCEL